MENPLVSIVIPIYNVEDYLRECLDSVVNQTYSSCEVLLVNDGSTDQSKMIAEEYAKKYSNMRLFDQENQGLSAARNTGIKNATGKYIYFLDSDDFLAPNAIESLVYEAELQDTDVIRFLSYDFEDGTKEYKCDHYNIQGSYPGKYDGIEFLKLQEKTKDFTITSCYLVFVLRSLITDAGLLFKDGILHEDNLFQFGLLLNAKNVVVLPEFLYYRRYRKGSIVTSPANWKRRFAGYMECAIEMDQLLSSHAELQPEEFSRYFENILHGAKTCFLEAEKQLITEKTQNDKKKQNEKEKQNYMREARRIIRKYKIPHSFPYRMFYRFPICYSRIYHLKNRKYESK